MLHNFDAFAVVFFLLTDSPLSNSVSLMSNFFFILKRIVRFYSTVVPIYCKKVQLQRPCDGNRYVRLAPDLKTIFHQCVIPYTCSQPNSDWPSELDWLQVYEMTH